MMKTLPDSAKINIKGNLEIGGCDLVDLAEEFGTPLYVMDEMTLRGQCRRYLESFQRFYPDAVVAFASKALCNVGISRIIASEGLGFDVSSGGELYTVLKAGADPGKVYFHGNNKSPKEIEEGLSAGVGRFVVDNEYELNNLEKAAEKLKKNADVLIRINPGIEAHTHEFIQTGKIDSKFGVPLEQLNNFIASVKKMKKIKLHGLHAHIGSQILDIKPFVEEAKLLVELSLKYGTREINIGGGIGIAYLPDQIQPDIEKFAGEIDAVLKGKDDLKLIIEPGRSIVGKAGVTLYSVGAVKEIPGVRKYVVVDGGMADNSRPILYDARYDACLANKPESPLVDNVRVAGRYCESGDILINEIMLPKVEAGDLLVMSCTGAYTYSMASNYNRVVRPAMVLVNSGSASIILKRESYKDLLSNDVI